MRIFFWVTLSGKETKGDPKNSLFGRDRSRNLVSFLGCSSDFAAVATCY
jgi:hypothetical protein